MKKYLLFALLVFLFACKDDEPVQTVVFAHLFPGNIGANANSTVIATDNNLVICGNFENDLLLLETTVDGTLKWRKTYHTTNNAVASAIAVTTAGDYFICGYSNRGDTNTDMFLAKFNADGDSVWTKSFADPGSDTAFCITACHDGNIVISGKNDAGITLMKVSPEGEIIWSNTPGLSNVTINHIIETSNGEIIACGETDPSSSRILWIKLNIDGSINMIKNYALSVLPGGAKSVIQISAGSLLTCGYQTYSTQYGRLIGGFVLKTDTSFNVLKSNSIEMNTTINYAVASFDTVSTCLTGVMSINDCKYLNVAYLDKNSDNNWEIQNGVTCSDYGANIVNDRSGNLVITGQSGDNIFVIRYDKTGKIY